MMQFDNFSGTSISRAEKNPAMPIGLSNPTYSNTGTKVTNPTGGAKSARRLASLGIVKLHGVGGGRFPPAG